MRNMKRNKIYEQILKSTVKTYIANLRTKNNKANLT